MNQTTDSSQGPERPPEPSDGASAPLDPPEDGADTPRIAVDVADALSGLAALPVDRHPEVYDDIHRRLGTTLSGIDHV